MCHNLEWKSIHTSKFKPETVEKNSSIIDRNRIYLRSSVVRAVQRHRTSSIPVGERIVHEFFSINLAVSFEIWKVYSFYSRLRHIYSYLTSIDREKCHKLNRNWFPPYLEDSIEFNLHCI